MPADLCRHGSPRAWCLGCEREAREAAESMAEAAASAQRTLADENARLRALCGEAAPCADAQAFACRCGGKAWASWADLAARLRAATTKEAPRG